MGTEPQRRSKNHSCNLVKGGVLMEGQVGKRLWKVSHQKEKQEQSRHVRESRQGQKCETVQFSHSVSRVTLCNLKDCSTPGFPVYHQLPEFTETHVHWVSDAIQPSHPVSSPSPLTFNLSQHQGLFKWVSSSHQMAKVSQFQFRHQSFQLTFRTDLL